MPDAFELIDLFATIVGVIGIGGFLLFVTTRQGTAHQIGAAGMIAAALAIPLGFFLGEIVLL